MKYLLTAILLISPSAYASKSAGSAATTNPQKLNRSKLSAAQAPATYDFLNEDWRLTIEQKIRNELEKANNFSASAKNIKITVVDDQILLRGQVNNFMEIERILSIVGELEPSYYIYNELTTK